MFCSKCGNQLAENARFCTKCGAQQGMSVAPVQQSTTVAAPRPVDDAGLGNLIITGGSTQKFTIWGINSLVAGILIIIFAIVLGNLDIDSIGGDGLGPVLAAYAESGMLGAMIFILIISGGYDIFQAYIYLSKSFHTEVSVFENGVKGKCLGKFFAFGGTSVDNFQITYDQIIKVKVLNGLMIYCHNPSLRYRCYPENANAIQQAIQERLKQAK